MPIAKLLRTTDIATLIGYEARTVRNWCDDGVFPTAQKIPATGNGQWRIKADDIALEKMLAGEDASQLLLTGYQERIAEQDNEISNLMERLEWYEANFPAYESRVHEQELELAQQSEIVNNQQQEITQLNTQLEKFKEWYQGYEKRRQQRRKAA